jgi:hypothetical protein
MESPSPAEAFSPASVWICRACGAYAAAGGALSFAGWFFGIAALTAWDGSRIAIQPNATVAAVSAGLALVFTAWRGGRVTAALGLIPLILGASTAFEHASGISLGIDTRLMFGRDFGQFATLAPGRMGVPATVSFTPAGAAILVSVLAPRLSPAAAPG